MTSLARLALSAAALVAAGAGAASAAAVPGALTAAEVKAQIVGHTVTNAPMVWSYFPDGHYEGGDDRVAHNGRYTVEADGRLCWREGPINGCFVYVRKGRDLILHRVDPGHVFELGPVKVERQ